MLRIATKTKLPPKEAIKKAINIFGPEGYKISITSQTDTSAFLEGGGGSVSVTVNKENKETTVELISLDWDYQAREFILNIC